MKLSVVIPTYNRAQMVCRCVQSVLDSTFSEMEVIVVDDCSTDGTQAAVNSQFGSNGRVRYFRNAVNLQLGASRNIGATRARGKYILFLDDDNLVEPEALANLVGDFEEHPEAGLIAPMAVNVGGRKDGCIWTLGSDFNRLTSCPKDFGVNLPLAELPPGRLRYPTLYSPNAFAVPKAVHEQVGGFCEQLPFYYDESDYGWRIVKTGRKAWILTSAITRHQNFLASGDAPELRDLGINAPWRAFLLGRNRLRFVRRHFNLTGILAVTFIFAPLSALYYSWVAIKNRRPDIACAYLRGTLAGIFR